jgi:SAM-dependent methyltransferase
MKILEIGPGSVSGKSKIFEQADTVDGYVGEPTFRARWGLDPLPIPDNTYDLVFASHVLEHIPWYRTQFALSEARRILKPGGELEIYVPDFEWIVQNYLDKTCGDAWRVFNPNDDFMTWVNGRIFTYGEDATELKSEIRPIPQTHHKAVFDIQHLKNCLVKADFNGVKPISRRHGISHGSEIGLLGVK